MTNLVKKLIFRGIGKKEQILFRSFFNLSRRELGYQVLVLDEQQGAKTSPDILIMDEHYSISSNDPHLVSVPCIRIGDLSQDDDPSYIRRPVKWSDYKLAMANLENKANLSEPKAKSILPNDIKFSLSESLSLSEVDSQIDEPSGNHNVQVCDYDLGSLSVDYQSFTNSEYADVASEVAQFNRLEEFPLQHMVFDNGLTGKSETDEQADKESIKIASETESLTVEDPYRIGVVIAKGEKYWQVDNEIILDHQPLFFIKTKRAMVYSSLDPASWVRHLRSNGLSRLPLDKNWKPDERLVAFPLSHLVWVDSLINQTASMGNGWNQKTEVMLTGWPPFELIQLDNVLLKLCTMLFVRPESVASLSFKTGCPASTVVGFINACDSLKIVNLATRVIANHKLKTASDDSMFGRIKEVFK